MATRKSVEHGHITSQDPPFAQIRFNTTKFAWLFLIIRSYLGWPWVQAGLHKLEDAKWVVSGEALKGYWMNAVKIPERPPPISIDWYRSFLQFLLDTGSYTWCAKLVAYGEFLIGVALIVGAFVGIAAFIGGLMKAQA